MAIAGEDLIYQFTLTDTQAAPVNFADVISMSAKFFNSQKVSVTKTKALLEIVQGSAANIYEIELQEEDTSRLSKGLVLIKITLVLPNAEFTDGEATKILESNFTLL
jgi:hypothetical protein